MTALSIQTGSMEQYVRSIMDYPMLTEEQEQEYSIAYKVNNCLKSAEKLILSHMKLVYAIARKYRGYNLPEEDLIQEGTIGLMKATKKYDISFGVRLSTYATHYIKGQIHEYIIKNFRLVKIATTKEQRKLFFNLRSMKQQFAQDDEIYHDSMTDLQIEKVSKELNVSKSDVLEMETRLRGGDIAFDSSDEEDTELVFANLLVDLSQEPTNVISNRKLQEFNSIAILEAIDQLSDREKHIVLARKVEVSDTGEGIGLSELASEYGVSFQRIAQIEASAMKKIKKYLLEYKQTMV